MRFGNRPFRPFFSLDVSKAVIGQRLNCPVCIGHALETAAAGAVEIRYKAAAANAYAGQVAIRVVGHVVDLYILKSKYIEKR